MKQGWTATITLVDRPFREEDPLDEVDIRQTMLSLLKNLPAGLTYQAVFIKKHLSERRAK